MSKKDKDRFKAKETLKKLENKKFELIEEILLIAGILLIILAWVIVRR